jgi:hypothetical protein
VETSGSATAMEWMVQVPFGGFTGVGARAWGSFGTGSAGLRAGKAVERVGRRTRRWRASWASIVNGAVVCGWETLTREQELGGCVDREIWWGLLGQYLYTATHRRAAGHFVRSTFVSC